MSDQDNTPRAPEDPIKHVIVLMLENRSFDQMLGALKSVDHLSALDGVDPDSSFSEKVPGEDLYKHEAISSFSIDPDPMHELKNVLRQIDCLADYRPPKEGSRVQWFVEWTVIGTRIALAWLLELVKRLLRKVKDFFKVPEAFEKVEYAAVPYVSKFVEDYALADPSTTRAQRQEIISYFALDSLPALHALGREFAVCDRWHSSVPGPTWANRFFIHTGTALGRVWMPDGWRDIGSKRFRPYTQETIFQRLSKKGKTWRIYYGDIPQTLVLPNQLLPENIENYAPITHFSTDTKDEPSFPDYCFIEPSYFLQNANDDHPPHHTLSAQCLIADVYNAIRSNEALWTSTLMVILYDEHGGFFDHVEPPKAEAPDNHADEYDFTTYGVRVPALLISPWARRGVFHDLLDHTSLLKYLADKWKLGSFHKRTDKANSLAGALDFASPPRLAVLPHIDDTDGMKEARKIPSKPENLSGLQRALLILVAWLDWWHGGRQARPRLSRDPEAQLEQAKNTLRRLLHQDQDQDAPRL